MTDNYEVEDTVILVATNKQGCSVSFFGSDEKDAMRRFKKEWSTKGFNFHYEYLDNEFDKYLDNEFGV